MGAVYTSEYGIFARRSLRNSGIFQPRLGSGSLNDVGKGRGRDAQLNIPLEDGVRDATFVRVFRHVACDVIARFRPEVMVCQCGADGLAGDPMNCFNLTARGLCDCVKLLQETNIPLLLLGGGN